MRFRFLQRALNISGFAGSGQANQHVTRQTKGRYLACENFIKTIIVARGSEQSAIACEANRRIRATVPGEAHHELSRKMCRVSRAAAISAHQQFISGTQTLLDQIGSFDDSGFEARK